LNEFDKISFKLLLSDHWGGELKETNVICLFQHVSVLKLTLKFFTFFDKII